MQKYSVWKINTQRIAQDFAAYARRRGSEERSVLEYVSTGATEDNTAEDVKDKQYG